MQITMLKNSCTLAIKELKQWMMPEKVVAPYNLSIICGLFTNWFLWKMIECNPYHFSLQAKTSLLTFPSSAEIVPEPLGVVLIISAWNYPFCMFIKQSSLYLPASVA